MEKTKILMNKDLIKVLLVEDDAVDRRLAERLLAKCSQPVEFAVESVRTLSAAVECLGGGEYDIVLLDLRLPDSSGIETIRKVSEASPHIPIVVLTVLDDREIELLAIKTGVMNYLRKDQMLEGLLIRTILYALEHKRAHEQLKKTLTKILRKIGETVRFAVLLLIG